MARKENPNPEVEAKMEETEEGTVLFNVPFPKDLSQLKEMSPILIKQPYQIDYLHSYGQDSPFFAGLANKKLLSTKCPKCGAAMRAKGAPILRKEEIMDTVLIASHRPVELVEETADGLRVAADPFAK